MASFFTALSRGILALCLVLFPLITSAQEASSEAASSVPASSAGLGSLTIEQKNEQGLQGKWTLIKPDQTKEEGTYAIRNWPELPAGRYTLFVEPPEGTSASIRLHRAQEELQSLMRPQITFTVAAGETLRLVVHYPFTRTGDVAVHSDPPGLTYKIWGPNDTILEGVTPYDYNNVPEGQYAIEFTPPEGCVKPARQSAVLAKDSRISLSVTLACAAADALRAQVTEQKTRLVSALIDGEDVTFTDVPQTAWFAAHAYKVAKWDVMAGYKDSRGNLTGLFGPENAVNIAELAKIAHKVSGINEMDITTESTNQRIHNEWFAPFMASAEHRGWTVYLDPTLDPIRPATRAEVLVTLLQALDVPIKWQKGNVFEDVSVRTIYASSIETAAGDEVVSGIVNPTGKPFFHPLNPVNRGELAKIIVLAVETYKEEEAKTEEKE